MEGSLLFMQIRESEADFNTGQPPAGTPPQKDLENAGALFLSLTSKLSETDTEQQLMEKAREFIVTNYDPLAVFLAVNESDPVSRFRLYSYSRLEGENEQA